MPGRTQRALALELPGPVVALLARRSGAADPGGGQQRRAEDGPGDDQAAGAQRRLAGLAAAAGHRDGARVVVRLGLGRSTRASGTATTGARRVRPDRRAALAAQQVADEHRRRSGGDAVRPWPARGPSRRHSSATLTGSSVRSSPLVAATAPIPSRIPADLEHGMCTARDGERETSCRPLVAATTEV